MTRIKRRFTRPAPREHGFDPYAEDPRADYVPEPEPVRIPRCRCGAPLARLDGWTLTTCFSCAEDDTDAAA